jgi:hypothetical protein
MSIFLRKIDSAVAVPVYTISENAIGIREKTLAWSAHPTRCSSARSERLHGTGLAFF